MRKDVLIGGIAVVATIVLANLMLYFSSWPHEEGMTWQWACGINGLVTTFVALIAGAPDS